MPARTDQRPSDYDSQTRSTVLSDENLHSIHNVFARSEVSQDIHNSPHSKDPASLLPALNAIPLLPDSGDEIGGYLIKECMNCGGQGQVFLAHDLRLDREVAMKVGLNRVQENGADCQQILREGRLLAQLNHPQLAQVYDCGIHDGHPYLVMEYVPGRTLYEELRQGRPSADRVKEILRQLCDAVEVLHEHGILHLDLKPENVMLTPDGCCKVIDLGNGWLQAQCATDEQLLLSGTPEYMAPEQITESPAAATIQTDIFGLGAVLYSLLVGVPIRPISEALTDCHISGLSRRRDDLRNAKIDHRLKTVCLKATEIDPQERYKNVSDLRRDLDRSPSPKLVPVCTVLLGLLSLVAASFFLTASSVTTGELPPTDLAQQSQQAVRLAPVYGDLHVLASTPENLYFFVYRQDKGMQLFAQPVCEMTQEEGVFDLSLRCRQGGFFLGGSSKPVTLGALQTTHDVGQAYAVLGSILGEMKTENFESECGYKVVSEDLTSRLGNAFPEMKLQAITINPGFPFEKPVSIQARLSMVDGLRDAVEVRDPFLTRLE